MDFSCRCRDLHPCSLLVSVLLRRETVSDKYRGSKAHLWDKNLETEKILALHFICELEKDYFDLNSFFLFFFWP